MATRSYFFHIRYWPFSNILQYRLRLPSVILQEICEFGT